MILKNNPALMILVMNTLPIVLSFAKRPPFYIFQRQFSMHSTKMKIIFMGTPTVASETLQYLHNISAER